MADRMLLRGLLLVLALAALAWGGLLVARPLKKAGHDLLVQVSRSTQGRIKTPQAYLSLCGKDWSCSLKLIPHLWKRMPRVTQRQGAGLMGLGVSMLLYLALTREVSKTIERRRFEPTHKVR